MLTLLLATVQWAQILGMLASNPAEDQFGEQVHWKAFSQKPFVLVIADKEAADLAKSVGIGLHTHYNGDYTAPEAHLTSSPPTERLKVIPVAALPDVPHIFRWLFRNGFRSGAKTGVILDWESAIAKSCGYVEGSVRLAVKQPDSGELLIADVKSSAEALVFVERCLEEHRHSP